MFKFTVTRTDEVEVIPVSSKLVWGTETLMLNNIPVPLSEATMTAIKADIDNEIVKDEKYKSHEMTLKVREVEK